MTCTECHSAKVRCEQVDGNTPCYRCTRRTLICQPHTSRQGQGPKKRKTSKNDGTSNRKRRNPNSSDAATQLLSLGAPLRNSEDDGLEPTEDGCLLQQLTTNPGVEVPDQEQHSNSEQLLEAAPKQFPNQNHFGLHYLIRSWLSFAFRRRSLSLLSRAAQLGARVGLDMDDLFCDNENESKRGMDFLYPILLVPRAEQKLVSTNTPLQWSNLPQRLLRQTQCMPTDYPRGDREQRWIWIREMKQGMSRYLVSHAFDRDICHHSCITQTWMENKRPVIDLFLVAESDKKKHTQGFAGQLAKWPSKNAQSTPTRIPRVQVSMLDNTTRIQSTTRSVTLMDQISYLEILNLDHAFYYVEYVLAEEDDMVVVSKECNSIAESTNHVGSTEPPSVATTDDTEPDLALYFNNLLNDDELDSFIKLMDDHPL